MITAYHFVGATLRDGDPVPDDGVWLEVAPPLVMCERGLHASREPFDALQYAPGATLCRVECDGEVIEAADKLVCSRRRIVARFDATDLLWQFARGEALAVIHHWNAPAVVREYLQTGDETLRAAAGAAAGDAAWAAAGAAAWDAAWAAAGAAAGDATWAAARAAARAAAGDATWAAARQRFNTLVSERFA